MFTLKFWQRLSFPSIIEKFLSVFARGRTHAMQAQINAATAPCTAAGLLPTALLRQSPKNVEQIAFIKSADAAVQLIFRSLVFYTYLSYRDYFLLSSFSIYNGEIILRKNSKLFCLGSNPRHASSDHASGVRSTPGKRIEKFF